MVICLAMSKRAIQEPNVLICRLRFNKGINNKCMKSRSNVILLIQESIFEGGRKYFFNNYEINYHKQTSFCFTKSLLICHMLAKPVQKYPACSHLYRLHTCPICSSHSQLPCQDYQIEQSYIFLLLTYVEL